MLARYNNQIVGQGLARLTDGFQQPNIRAWLAAILTEAQALEDATWTVLTGRFLATATVYDLPETNTVFDVIGELVGQQRGALSDLELKTLIYLRIAVNRAAARVSDWARFAQILAPFCDDTPSFYGDQAGIYFGAWNLVELNPNQVNASLARAMGNGIRGCFAYSTWSDGDDLEWCDVNNESTTGQGAWGDSVAGVVGGLLVSGAKLQ